MGALFVALGVATLSSVAYDVVIQEFAELDFLWIAVGVAAIIQGIQEIVSETRKD